MNWPFKITIIGSGNIANIMALLIGLKELGNVYLYDIIADIAEGKSLDISQLKSLESINAAYEGSTSPEIMKDSDVIIITAGSPRKPGMSRNDLLTINGKTIQTVAHNAKKYSANAFVVCVTNPLDSMVEIFRRESGFPAHRVVGMAGTLDGARFNYYLAKHLGISSESIHSCVMGSHGDAMMLLPKYTSIAGIPLEEFLKSKKLTEDDLNSIIEKTRFGGHDIVKLLKNGSAFFTPASAVIQMVKSHLWNQNRILYCTVFLTGQYGIKNCYAGVPCIIGNTGVKEIIELTLSPEELSGFQTMVDQTNKLVEVFYN